MFEHKPISRAMARAKLIDEPRYINDALGGYVYSNDGNYIAPQMPPVVAAVAAVAGYVVANAAVISMVGAGLSVVGAVTGNKTLMKIGGVMGIVGGVAGIANALSNGALQSSLNAAAGEMVTDSAVAAAAEAAGSAATGAVTEGAKDVVSETAADSVLNTTAVTPGAPTIASTPQATGLIGQSSVPTVGEIGNAAASTGGNATLGSTAGAQPIVQAPAHGLISDPVAAIKTGGSMVDKTIVGAQTASSGSAWDSILKIADSKGGAQLIKTGGDMLSGYANGQAQQQQLDAQNAERKRQIDNVNAFGRIYGGAGA